MFDKIALAIAIIGGLNWGSIGIFGFDLVAALFGAGSVGSRIVYTLVGLSALLTGLNLYNKIARFGGAGTLVPVTGFANAVVSPAIDFRSEGFVTGMAAKMFLVAGPVLVFGTVAAAIYGVVLLIV